MSVAALGLTLAAAYVARRLSGRVAAARCDARPGRRDPAVWQFMRLSEPLAKYTGRQCKAAGEWSSRLRAACFWLAARSWI